MFESDNTSFLDSKDCAVVVGTGLSGMAAARLLHSKGVPVRVLERNAASVPEAFAAWANSAGVVIQCGEHSPEDFAGASAVIPSPGVAASVIRPLLPAVNPPAIMAETELAWRLLTDEPVLAVTGTSGKTTTTSLCAAMLAEQGLRVFTGGNIGTPLSEYVLSVQEGGAKADVVVLELSSFQLQTCSTLRPRVGVLLNLSENHLDFHADMREYLDAKMQLFACQTADDVAILHPELNDLQQRYAMQARTETYSISRRFAGTRLLGTHNQANAEAAWLACREFGVTEAAAVKAVADFVPLEHRLEHVATREDVWYVNDSKCTTIDALRVALEAFDRPVILLAGGKFKGGDVEGLCPLLRRTVRCVTLYGGSREHFEPVWKQVVPVSWDATLEAALQRASRLAQAGDVVLLAPATSSYDQYPNYLRRGEDFKQVVKRLCEDAL